MKELLTEKEFLTLIKISRATLNKYKSKHLITHYKAGRRVLYDEKSLDDFKNNCAQRVEAHLPTDGLPGRNKQ
jgi:hypothetical protein